MGLKGPGVTEEFVCIGTLQWDLGTLVDGRNREQFPPREKGL